MGTTKPATHSSRTTIGAAFFGNRYDPSGKSRLKGYSENITASGFERLLLLKERWRRTRRELRRIRKSDVVIVSYPKCGRTWLRVLLSRYFQTRYNLPAGILIGRNKFRHRVRGLPNIYFTHDLYAPFHTGQHASPTLYSDKRVVFLTRDARDATVSLHYHLRNRINRFQRELVGMEAAAHQPLLEFMVESKCGLAQTVQYQITWSSALKDFPNSLSVRYEDLYADAGGGLSSILEFLDETPTALEIEDAVEFASFENMQKLERAGVFTAGALSSSPTSGSDAQKARSGKIGGYRDHFSASEIESIDRIFDAITASAP